MKLQKKCLPLQSPCLLAIYQRRPKPTVQAARHARRACARKREKRGGERARGKKKADSRQQTQNKTQRRQENGNAIIPCLSLPLPASATLRLPLSQCVWQAFLLRGASRWSSSMPNVRGVPIPIPIPLHNPAARRPLPDPGPGHMRKRNFVVIYGPWRACNMHGAAAAACAITG